MAYMLKYDSTFMVVSTVPVEVKDGHLAVNGKNRVTAEKDPVNLKVKRSVGVDVVVSQQVSS